MTSQHAAISVARVIVDIPTRAIREAFDYAIPASMSADVAVGVPVLVPLGGRRAVGYVTAVPTDSAFATLKPLEAVLGPALFDETAVRIAAWIAREYVSPISEALRLFLPPGGAPKVRRTDDGWAFVAAEVAAVDERWAELAVERAYVTLAPRATMQRAVVDALSGGPLRTSELGSRLGAVSSALGALERSGTVRTYRAPRLRAGSTSARPAPRHEALTAGQLQALASIQKALGRSEGTIVLHGVTGSGKTEVYMRALERVVDAGGAGIVLVPEISLTPQTVGRFRTRFGASVAVLHSRLGPGERYDEWHRALSGDARVVVGARSALFAPVRDLRLIVIDEEHEPSYKQGSAPRYDARATAAMLASERGAVLVLGSATPRLETLTACGSAGVECVRMPDRVGGRPLPEVRVVDMAQEFADGHRSMFSRPLASALTDVADHGDKAVLFLNRRGFASFLLCRECGFVPKCDDCSTSLTYHEVGRRLVCHHCDRRSAVPVTCPACGGPYLRLFGAGTQRVQTELAQLLPDLAVVRMDADTTSGKGGHEKALARFEELASGVLLGTQMVAKGLDYPEVTLVGVLNADTGLHLPDFRAAERTYHLLEQVAGRAGRGSSPGLVIIQTYWPDHPAIRAAAAHDPSPLVAEETADRSALGYPPFGRLANLVITAKSDADAADCARRVHATLAEGLPAGWRLVGPAPAPLARVRGAYRWHVLVKTPLEAALGGALGEAMLRFKSPEGCSVTVDVDPADLL